jgi:hypothetical protein
VLPETFPTILGLVIGATGNVVLHVGVLFTYERTGESVPRSFRLRQRGRARESECSRATTIVVSFKVVSFLVVDRSLPHHLLDRSIKILSKRDEAAAAMRSLKPEFSFQKT